MKRHSILGGIAFAFIVSALSVPGWWLWHSLFSFDAAVKITLAIAYLVSVAYVLWTSNRQTGIPILAVVNLLLAVTIPLISLDLSTGVILFAVLLSLNRSLVHTHSLTAAAVDMTIAFGGLLFAGYLYGRSGGPIAAVWGFLLVQSLWVLVPARLSFLAAWQRPRKGDQKTDAFVVSRRQAEAAIERITDFSHISGFK